jgi:hypothetical protein
MESTKGAGKKKSKIGLYLAIAALLVNGPRFVIVFLRADAISLPTEIEASMLGITGLATGIVLTGGGAYISHRLADSRLSGMIKTSMVACWLALLVFSVILLSPLMVQSIRTSELKAVISSDTMQWAWSITSILAVEVVASGAMAAHAIEGRRIFRSRRTGTPSLIGILVAAIADRIRRPHRESAVLSASDQGVAPINSTEQQPTSDAEVNPEPVEIKIDDSTTPEAEGRVEEQTTPEAPKRRRNKKESISRMLEILKEEPTLTPAEIGIRIGKDKVTVSSYLKELAEKNVVTPHDQHVAVTESGELAQ